MGLVRLFLALSVVMVHNGYNQTFIGGTFAVMLFFIISGFCMALVLNGKYTEANPTRFYVARYLRLWPTYFIALVLTVTLIRPFPDFGDSLLAYFPTFTLFGHEYLWWAGVDGPVDTLIGKPMFAYQVSMQHMWSVGIEIAFYAVSPLFARNMRTTLALFLGAFACHVILTLNLHPQHPQIMRSPLNYFWLYLMGMLAYWVWRRSADTLGRWNTPAVSVAIAGVVAAGFLTHLRSTPLLSGPLTQFRNDFSLILFAVIIVPLFHYTRNTKWDRMIGELSYPLYVVHWPIAAYLVTGHRGDLWWSLAIAAMSVAAAILMHVAVERPIDKWRSTLFGPRLRPIAALTQ